MSAEAVRDAAFEQGSRTPVGTINVVDPHPLNWLYITWNTMEEPVRTNEKGNIVGAAMEDSFWEGATLVVKVPRATSPPSPNVLPATSATHQASRSR